MRRRPVASASVSTIRAGRLDGDVTACVELWVEAVTARDGAVPDPPALVERMTRKFDQPALRFAVIDADPDTGDEERRVAGFALTVVRSSQPPGGDAPNGPVPGFLEMLAVAPDQAGRGLGRALLADAVAAAERAGCPGLDLQVRDGNARALSLYRSAGVARIGDPEPHSDGGAPMITMTTRP